MQFSFGFVLAHSHLNSFAHEFMHAWPLVSQLRGNREPSYLEPSPPTQNTAQNVARGIVIRKAIAATREQLITAVEHDAARVTGFKRNRLCFYKC